MTFTVATWNLYLGADIVPAIRALPSGGTESANQFRRDLADCGFAERSGAVAREIAATAPDVIGLQEMVTWVDITPARVRDEIDHLSVLIGQLRTAGEPYEVIVTAETYDVDLPLGADHRLGMRNHDVLLARHASLAAGRLTIDDTGARTYASSYHRDAHAHDRSGWVWADITIDGAPARIHSTHLDAASTAIREAQAGELADAARTCPRPPVIVGDLNATPQTTTLRLLHDIDLTDTWADAVGSQGATWGHGDDCRSDDAPTHRLDYVLCPDTWRIDGAALLGADPDARSDPGRLWPSDHNGVLAHLDPG